MPRALRCDVAEHLYLALNRGNQRDTIFDKDGDFEAFLTVSLGQSDGRARLGLVKEICKLADRGRGHVRGTKTTCRKVVSTPVF